MSNACIAGPVQRTGRPQLLPPGGALPVSRRSGKAIIGQNQRRRCAPVVLCPVWEVPGQISHLLQRFRAKKDMWDTRPG